MRVILLLPLLLVGCAHVKPGAPGYSDNYIFGHDDRPYTGIPKYLQEAEAQPKPPASVCDACPPDTRERL